jgi:co-chaperonin GroES (HSP10)
MKSPHYFIVRPLDSQRYANLSDSGLVLNTSLEDHNFTQRVASVVSTPIGHEGDVEVGDLIVVHHNTFRVQYNNQGMPLESKYHIQDDLFYVEIPLAYMVIKGDKKIALPPYCFVEQSQVNDKWQGLIDETQYGFLRYKNKDMVDFNEGDKVALKQDSEYEFNLFGEKLYMINQNRILFTV